MRMKFWAVAGLVLLVLMLLADWPVSAQTSKQADGDIGARLDRIEKQLVLIQEQLKRLEGAKPGWQKVKETDRTVSYIESTSGKVKFVYTDGSDRVVEK